MRKVKLDPAQSQIVMQSHGTGPSLTIEVGSQSKVGAGNGVPAQLDDIVAGDWVPVSATASPDHALWYTSTLVLDSAVHVYTNHVARVTSVMPGPDYILNFGGTKVALSLGPGKQQLVDGRSILQSTKLYAGEILFRSVGMRTRP